MTGGTLLSRNCQLFLENLERVAGRCGKRADEITVVAVAKTRTFDEVKDAVSAGLKEIGENRVQEAEQKYIGATRDFRLHMIGHLQSNKAKTAARLFDVIQSVDSIRLAELLDNEFERLGKTGEIMLEVNTSGEAQKYGFAPEQTVAAADKILEMKHLTLTGLMTVGPLTDDREMMRASFGQLRRLFESIKANHPDKEKFRNLSMGMTDDYEIAVEEGSTMIRVGRALFGSRTS